ncbi:FtsK/SpoIIIE domain-containing protein [Agromyces soli]|uniref:FtsK domain-containing protein n=1 Tax=Agromyces soli TaxID=659012 RepID=A0ABY4ARU9_9MICO|nr:FtsK/SpoIIIE domain-containing protein [Agromyces soli]UOE25901.1 hypothetical protein MTP13_16545 [Agromyces soli]
MDLPTDRQPRLRLPHPPSTRQKPPFPLLATLAPIATAGVLFALTRSPLALVFAAIGPVVGLAAVFDGRRSARRHLKRERLERIEARRLLTDEIAERHAVERVEAWRRAGELEALLSEPAGSRWRTADSSELVLGRGVVPSGLRIEGEAFDDDDRALLARAWALSDAPIRADPAAGIGFVGPMPVVRAAVRASVVRWASTVRPGAGGLRVPPLEEWAWAERLPQLRGSPSITVVEGEQPADPRGVIACAIERAALPPGLGTVVELDSPRRARIEVLDSPERSGAFVPELLSSRHAATAADRLAEVAERSGLDAKPLPLRVDLAALTQPPAGGRERLAAAVGTASGGGALELDLVQQGPHALIGGTTGSGKSEFLLAWLAALATMYSPAALAMLLVDFKGGAAFRPIAELPHVVGIVTDLDEAEALRAVESLRAEIRQRERRLRQSGARDFVELDRSIDLPRLVIVVDEYQALLERFDELGRVFADLAARGRSLGMHLILSTQRPNGTVREQITANCRLRVCLRVLHPSDSRAVVGVDDAARIPPDRPGRAIVDDGTGPPRTFQSAIADPLHLELLQAGRAGEPQAKRPWLDPLPSRLRLGQLDPTPDGIVFGLLDAPEEQRRMNAVWRPAADGALLVCGAPGSGRRTTLDTIAAAFAARHGPDRVVRLPEQRSLAWDLLTGLARQAESPRLGGGPRLLLVDAADVRFRSWPDEYRLAAAEALATILDDSSGGLHLAVSATRPTGLPAEIRDGFRALLLLRHASRGELAQLGGEPSLWRADDPPGAGQWGGKRLQVAMTDPPGSGAMRAGSPPLAGRPDPASVLEFQGGGRYAVIARNVPLALARLAEIEGIRVRGLTAAGAVEHPLAPADESGRPEVLVGDLDAWAAAWRLWGELRQTAVVIVDGGLAEFRTLYRGRELPPLLDRGAGQGWRVSPDGGIARFVWPERRFRRIHPSKAPSATGTIVSDAES